jgi:hypothetical protein
MLDRHTCCLRHVPLSSISFGLQIGTHKVVIARPKARVWKCSTTRLPLHRALPDDESPRVIRVGHVGERRCDTWENGDVTEAKIDNCYPPPDQIVGANRSCRPDHGVPTDDTGKYYVNDVLNLVQVEQTKIDAGDVTFAFSFTSCRCCSCFALLHPIRMAWSLCRPNYGSVRTNVNGTHFGGLI